MAADGFAEVLFLPLPESTLLRVAWCLGMLLVESWMESVDWTIRKRLSGRERENSLSLFAPRGVHNALLL